MIVRLNTNAADRVRSNKVLIHQWSHNAWRSSKKSAAAERIIHCTVEPGLQSAASRPTRLLAQGIVFRWSCSSCGLRQSRLSRHLVQCVPGPMGSVARHMPLDST